jgi:hypothetical protein
MYKPKATLVTPEEKIRLDMQRPRAERILNLLRLIRLSSLVSEAGAKYRKSR